MFSRGFGAFVALASVVQVQAWTAQRDVAKKAFVPEQKETINTLAEAGRHAASLGFGCFLAAATAFATPAFADAGKFSYDPNLGGPETWSTLKVEGNQCSGSKQSPIAIKPTACNVGANYEFKHGTCTTNSLDYALGRNGPKASFPPECAGTTMRIPFVEGVFEAVQFHMHIGSEHTIGGQRYESEFHIVHKQKGGDRFAVVGIMLNGDAKTPNIKFQRLLDGWEQVAQKVAADCGDEVLKKKPRTVTEEFNIYDLIPPSANFYHYDGSLTTPPCSEVSC